MSTTTCNHTAKVNLFAQSNGVSIDVNAPCRICEIMASDLPALSGSEKQVAWAMDIRATQIFQIECAIARYNREISVETDAVWVARYVLRTALAQAKIEELKKITSATAWINARNSGYSYISFRAPKN